MTLPPRFRDDPFDAQGDRFGDRPQVHSGLREAGPVVCVEAPAGGEAFIVTEYELAREVPAGRPVRQGPGAGPSALARPRPGARTTGRGAARADHP